MESSRLQRNAKAKNETKIRRGGESGKSYTRMKKRRTRHRAEKWGGKYTRKERNKDRKKRKIWKKILRLKKNLKRITSFPSFPPPRPPKKTPSKKNFRLHPPPSSWNSLPPRFSPSIYYTRFQFSGSSFSPPLSFSFPLFSISAKRLREGWDGRKEGRRRKGRGGRIKEGSF